MAVEFLGNGTSCGCEMLTREHGYKAQKTFQTLRGADAPSKDAGSSRHRFARRSLTSNFCD